MHIQKITLIGVGLLGGSIGLAIKKQGWASRVDGFVRRTASIAECLKLGVADQVTRDLDRAVTDADLVIFCTPIAQMRGLCEQMLPTLKPGAVVTDVGSVKGTVVQEMESLVQDGRGYFVGSHPMAGAEKMGVSAAQANLFENTVCVITPTPRSVPHAVQLVKEFWKALGSRPMELSPELHDDLVSRCSHLPHIVAAELANYVLSPVHPKEQAMLCANGFRDTTRIASGSPEMWRDIALANRKNLSRVLGVFIEDMQEFQLALDTTDLAGIAEFFEKAKQRRDAWIAQCNSPE